MRNNETHHNHKHTGIHYLTIVQQPEEEIQREVEAMSKVLDGAPVVFVGYEVDNGEPLEDE